MCEAFSLVFRKLQLVFSESQNLRPREAGATSGGHLAQALLHQGHPEPAAQDVSTRLLSLSSDGDSTTSLDTCPSARPPSQCRGVS